MVTIPPQKRTCRQRSPGGDGHCNGVSRRLLPRGRILQEQCRHVPLLGWNRHHSGKRKRSARRICSSACSEGRTDLLRRGLLPWSPGLLHRDGQSSRDCHPHLGFCRGVRQLAQLDLGGHDQRGLLHGDADALRFCPSDCPMGFDRNLHYPWLLRLLLGMLQARPGCHGTSSSGAGPCSEGVIVEGAHIYLCTKKLNLCPNLPQLCTVSHHPHAHILHVHMNDCHVRV